MNNSSSLGHTSVQLLPSMARVERPEKPAGRLTNSCMDTYETRGKVKTVRFGSKVTARADPELGRRGGVTVREAGAATNNARRGIMMCHDQGTCEGRHPISRARSH